MSKQADTPYAELERVFHEPNRLAIMSSLCGATEGMTFRDIKTACDLTDGNLSRHLKALDKARAIRIKKAFVRSRPRTTVYVTARGRKSFIRYLQALEAVLQEAARKAGATSPRSSSEGRIGMSQLPSIG